MILVIAKYLKSYLKAFITKKITIDKTEKLQDEFNAIIGVLENYTPRNNKYVEARNKLLNNVKKKFTRREKKLLKGLKTDFFYLIMMKRGKNKRDTKEKKKKKYNQK